MKICCDCHEAKPQADFYGQERRCKPCSLKRNAENRRKRKAALRASLFEGFSPMAQAFYLRRETWRPN